MNLPEMPHSREAEEAVLGVVMTNPDTYYDVSVFLRPDDFYVYKNQWAWSAIEKLIGRNVPVDIITVAEELDRASQLDEIGGRAYLTKLIASAPPSYSAESYGKIIESHSTRRKMITAAQKIGQLAYDESNDIERAAGEAMAAMGDVTERAAGSSTEFSQRVFGRVYDAVEELSRQPADFLPGIPTGLIDLDRVLGGGLKNGRLYTIAGRPGAGKTALGLTILHNASFGRRKRGAIFSLEMSNDEVAGRLVSIDSGVDGQLIETGKLSDTDWPAFTNSLEAGSLAPVAFDDTANLTPRQLLAKCQRIRAMSGLDYVIVDYLGLMSGDHSRYENRNAEVSAISRSMKSIARELNVPVVQMHQMNREVEKISGKEPELHHLRDSGSIEQDSDAVLFIWPDEATGVTRLKIAKHRNGPTGLVTLVFRKNITKFENSTKININDCRDL